MKECNLEEFYEEERRHHDTRVASHIVSRAQIYHWEKPLWAYTKGTLGDIRGKTILDLGCGLGREAVLFAMEGAVVTGIDFSEESIRKAKDLAMKMGVDITFELRNVDRIDFKNEFDVVYCRGSLHHFPDPKKIIERSYGFLKEGGVMVTQEPKSENFIATIGRRFFMPTSKTERPFKLGQLEQIFNKVFQKVRVKYFFILSPLCFTFTNIGLINNKKLLNTSSSILNAIDERLLLIPFMKKYTWLEVIFGKKTEGIKSKGTGLR